MSIEDSCFGEYPDNECDIEICHNMCEDVEWCIKTTKEREQ